MTGRLANLFEVAAVLAVAATVLGFFGGWHYFPDLLSHFRIQAAIALVASALGLYLLKRRRWSIPVAAAGALLVASLWPFFLPAESGAGATHRLLLLNVRTDNPGKGSVAELIFAADPDFVVLLETDAEWIVALDSALDADWPYRRSLPRGDNFGLALYSKLPWESCHIREYAGALSTPSLSARFDLPDGRVLRLIGVHPPPPMNDALWRSRNELFRQLADDVRGDGGSRTVVAGDLNCTPWSTWFGRLEKDSGLRNAAYRQGLLVSWRPLPSPLLGLPIDHVLVGDQITISRAEVGPDVGSDHRPVIVDFR